MVIFFNILFDSKYPDWIIKMTISKNKPKKDFFCVAGRDKNRTDFIKIKKGQTPLSYKRRMPPRLSLTSLSKDYGEETTSNKLFTV